MHTGLISHHLKMVLKIFLYLYKIDNLVDHIHPFLYNFLRQHLLMPAAGQYTIGVFRINLVELEGVEPTVFQLTVTTME